MTITRQQLMSYQEDGFLLIPGCFSQEEVGILKEELTAESMKGGDRVIF